MWSEVKRSGAWSRAQRPGILFCPIVGLALLLGCGEITENQLPQGAQDPRETNTPKGAIAAYRGVGLAFLNVLDEAVFEGALLTDEFGPNNYGTLVFFGQPAGYDRRHLPETFSNRSFVGLHLVRGEAQEAIGLLAAYAPEESPALMAHAYALAGFAEILLADLYCSGIPLSTLDFGGDYTLKPGSRTEAVYLHALGLLDTAVTLASDSARILNLARVGRGRTLLALGRYSEAGQAVAAVPDGFSYEVLYPEAVANLVTGVWGDESVFGFGIGATMTDGDGGGLDYLSSADPRVAAVPLGQNRFGFSIFRPAKYEANGRGSLVVADWIEARLIEAEAALQAGDPVAWLRKLNYLRQTAWTTIRPAIDTALSDLTDPGTNETRVNLTFRERAFWLFVTGHRQGDLRRLIREYGRDPESVYPSGPYPDGQGRYGSDVTIPVPESERTLNPQYTGCINREA